MMTLTLPVSNGTFSSDNDDLYFRSKLLPWEDAFVGTYLCVICILAVALNILVIYTCLCNWSRLTRQDSYILNLACSDVILPLSGFPLAISSSYHHQWLYGDGGCTLYGFLGFYFGLVSIITLTIMGLTRYIKICHPHINITGKSFSRLTVIFPYVYAIIWSAIPLGGVGSYSLESYGTSCTLQWDENRAYITLMSAFCIATPAVLITFTYGLILLKCRRSSNKLRTWQSASHKMSAKDSYLIKITFAMCWGFLFSWLPYAVVSMWTAYGDGKTVPVRLTVVAVLSAKSSIVINPTIYFLLSKKFRPLMLKALKFRSRSTKHSVTQTRADTKLSRDFPPLNRRNSFKCLSSSELSNSADSAVQKVIKVQFCKGCTNEVEL